MDIGVHRSAVLLTSLALALAAVSCGGGGNEVSTTLQDFSISLDPASADAGEVTFAIENQGPSEHEFVVFRTDLAPDALPTVEEAGVPIVDEAGEGVELVDEVEAIAPDATPELTVNLDAGNYVMICNITGHYDSGMATGFEVA